MGKNHHKVGEKRKRKRREKKKKRDALDYISVCPLPVPGGTELIDETETCEESE